MAEIFVVDAGQPNKIWWRGDNDRQIGNNGKRIAQAVVCMFVVQRLVTLQYIYGLCRPAVVGAFLGKSMCGCYFIYLL